MDHENYDDQKEIVTPDPVDQTSIPEASEGGAAPPPFRCFSGNLGDRSSLRIGAHHTKCDGGIPRRRQLTNTVDPEPTPFLTLLVVRKSCHRAKNDPLMMEIKSNARFSPPRE